MIEKFMTKNKIIKFYLKEIFVFEKYFSIKKNPTLWGTGGNFLKSIQHTKCKKFFRNYLTKNNSKQDRENTENRKDRRANNGYIWIYKNFNKQNKAR